MNDSEKTHVVNTTNSDSSNENSKNPKSNNPDTKKGGIDAKSAAIGGAVGAAAGIAAGTVFSEEIKDGAASIKDFITPDGNADNNSPAPVVDGADGQSQTTASVVTEPVPEPIPEPVAQTPEIPEDSHHEPEVVVNITNVITGEPQHQNHEVVEQMIFETPEGTVEVMEFVDVEGDGLVDNVNTYEYTSEGELLVEEHATTQEIAESMGANDIGHDIAPEMMMDENLAGMDSEDIQSNEFVDGMDSVDSEVISDVDLSSEMESTTETENIDWESADNMGSSEISTEAINEVDDSSSPDEAYQDLLNESDFSSDDYYSNNEDYSGSDFV
jgi:hypothetical protein